MSIASGATAISAPSSSVRPGGRDAGGGTFVVIPSPFLVIPSGARDLLSSRPASRLDAAPAVDFEAGARDEARFVGREEHGGGGNVRRLRQAAERNRRDELRAALGRVLAHEVREHGGFAGDRIDDVHADV